VGAGDNYDHRFDDQRQYRGYCGALSTSGQGTVRIENTTISGNYATFSGCISASSATIANSTVASVPASFLKATLALAAAVWPSVRPAGKARKLDLRNNSIADLFVSTSTVISGHNNLMMLGATGLRNRREAVSAGRHNHRRSPAAAARRQRRPDHDAMRLRAGSPAIDAGNNLAAFPSDQRGSPFLRIAGAKPTSAHSSRKPTPLNRRFDRSAPSPAAGSIPLRVAMD
jgi:hypothetical protein